MPQVSVVTAVFNRARFVTEAARSVMAQTLDDWEWVVFDDGSTDDSIDRIRDVVGDDPRVRFCGGTTNHGNARALQLACDQATAPLVGWLDSDDRLRPAALKTTAGYLKDHPRIGMVYSRYAVMDAASKVRGEGSRNRIPYSPQQLLTDFMVFHFRLYRQDAAARAGGVGATFPAANDYDFVLRMSEHCEIRGIPDVLYDYRVHGESISSARRLDQIRASEGAINAALQRRGMADEIALHVELQAKFRLLRKPKA